MLVPEDTTLDAFVDSDGATDEEAVDGSAQEDESGGPVEAEGANGPTDGDQGEGPIEGEQGEGPTESGDTDPAVIEATMVWRPDAAECASCGSSNRRLWQDGGTLVCPDCKNWDRA